MHASSLDLNMGYYYIEFSPGKKTAMYYYTSVGKLWLPKTTYQGAEAIPWCILSVDHIGPYKIIREGQDEPLILKYLTMI